MVVTSAGDRGSGHGGDCGDGGRGSRDGGRGGGRGQPRRCNYCDMNDHTEEYYLDKWGRREYAHQVYNENIQFTTSAPRHDAFGSN